MPKVTPLLNAFNAGEWSPKLKGRSDLEKYTKACETMENFYPFRHGGASRRPGSYYIGACKYAGKKARPISFEFSTTQAYILEFADQYLRVIKDHGLVNTVDANTDLLLHMDGDDASTTFADDGDTGHTVTAHGNAQIDTSDKVFGTGCGKFDGTDDYLTVPNHADFAMGSGKFNIGFRVKFDDIAWTHGLFGHYASGTDNVYCWLRYALGVNTLAFRINVGSSLDLELSYVWADVAVDTWYKITIIRGWGGNANDWALCINGAAVDVVTSNTTAWADQGVAFLIGGFVSTSNLLKGSLDEFRANKAVPRHEEDFTPPATEYPQAGGGTTYELATPYLEEDLPYLKVAQSADTMWIVHPSHRPRKLTRTGHAAWSLDLYAPTGNPFSGAGLYPSCIAFFEERILFAGSKTYPQRIYSTKSGDWEDMTVGTGDADAFIFTLAADQVNVIRWLAPRKYLMLGTIGGEWRIWSGEDNAPMTPSNVKASRESSYGSADFQPVIVGPVTLFLQRLKRKIRELVYSFEADGWKAPDLSILAEHITDGGIISALAYQPEPHSILYMVRSDGVLLGMVYDREQDVIAWFRWVAAESGEYESIAVIPGLDDEYELYVVVKRTVDGSTVRHLEYFMPFEQGSVLADHRFLDAMLTYDGGATGSISGLDHLEGESVYINADGVFQGPYTVSSGAISFSPDASKVQIGLLQDGIIQLMPSDFGSAIGTALGKRKHISGFWVRYLNTKEFYYGLNASNLTLLSNTGLESGAERVTPLGGWEEDAQPYIKTYGVHNCTILAIVPELVTSD